MMDPLWNPDEANDLLRSTLAEIERLSEKLPAARVETLLEAFEQEIGHAFLCQDIAAVGEVCVQYARRFRALAEKE